MWPALHFGEEFLKLKDLKIYSFDNGNLSEKTARFIYKINNVKSLLEFKFGSGDLIRVTPEHPFLVFDKKANFSYRRADEIDNGTFIVTPQSLPFKPRGLKVIKSYFLKILKEGGGFVVFLNQKKSKFFFKKLKKEGKYKLASKNIFSSAHNISEKKYRLKLSDFINIGGYFNFSDDYLYDLIDFIKNSSPKWRAGHTSHKISLPKTKSSFKKFGYVLGCIAGDGYINKIDVILNNNDKEIQEVYSGFIKEIFKVRPIKRTPKNRVNTIYSGGGKTFSRIVQSIFHISPGKKSHKIDIPELVLYSNEILANFIAGWLDTDGYISKINNSIEITSKSGDIVRKTSIALLRFGVHSTIFSKNGYYYLKISNKPYLKRFLQYIKPKLTHKRNGIKEAIKKAGTSRIFDLIPISGSWISTFKIDNRHLPYFNRYRSYKILSRHFLQKIYSLEKEKFSEVFKNTNLKNLINPGEISLVKVINKKKIKNEYGYVLDFTVPETENFIAERLIVHNTKILDYIRKTKVADQEAGGITQHIGAYQIEVPKEPKSRESKANRGIPRQARDDFANRKITFLDTPGHEAFSAIRSRGTKVADIAILVVAADEGVKPQTKEAIAIIKQVDIPFVVAINKIDKEGINPQKVMQELAENNVLVEKWGGQVPAVEISAKFGQGINELIETILLLAELEELKANPLEPASGAVIESHLDNRRGIQATLLIENGTLRINDWIVAGKTTAKIKAMEDFLSRPITEALPAEAVVVFGWQDAPILGGEFKTVKSKKEAEKIANENIELGPIPLFSQESGTENVNKKFLNITLKADVRSSLEAIEQILKSIKSEEVGWRVISYGVGNISDSDIKSAITSNGVVFGFHVDIEPSSAATASRENVYVKTFAIIYDLVEDMRNKLSELLEPEIKRNILSKVKILALFKKGVGYQVVGGKVISGKAVRGALAEAFRGNQPIIKGRIIQLQHEKVDVAEVAEGLECGIKFEPGEPFIKEGDVVEIYEEEKIKRTI